jgi:hypothetical protein
MSCSGVTGRWGALVCPRSRAEASVFLRTIPLMTRTRQTTRTASACPPSGLEFFSRLVAFDHDTHEVIVIANILHDSGQRGLRAKHARARADIREITTRLSRPLRSTPVSPRPAR